MPVTPVASASPSPSRHVAAAAPQPTDPADAAPASGRMEAGALHGLLAQGRARAAARASDLSLPAPASRLCFVPGSAGARYLEQLGRRAALPEETGADVLHMLNQVCLAGHGRDLHGLNLADMKLVDAQAVDLSVILQQHPMPLLQKLSLRNSRLGMGTLVPLLQLPQLETLHELDLGGLPLGLRGTRALCGATDRPFVRRLRLAGCALTPSCVLFVLNARRFASLLALDVSNNDLGRPLAEALCKGEHTANLLELEIGGNQLGAEGAHMLSNASVLHKLRGLGLRSNALGQLGAGYVVKRPTFGNLRALNLADNGLDAAALAEIAAAPLSCGLDKLDVSDNPGSQQLPAPPTPGGY